jgi:hypothetical protein
MPVALPDSLAAGLREIAELSDSVFEEFLSLLRSIRTEIKQYRVFDDADITLPALADGGKSIKGAAFALLLSRGRRHDPVDEFVADLIDTVSSTAGFESTSLEILKRRATAILNIESLDLVARAHDVLLEHSNIFSSARIVSDLRPVFGETVTEPPLAVVLVHMLSIAFRSAGRRENFVVALNDKDIHALLQVLERAKTKSATLQESVKRADMTYVKVV